METDILGAPYQRRTIDLGTDDEGPVVATLVSRRAPAKTDRAVLYVHGYVDYFFQEHLADFYVERGFDFYALDLRKYGRSLLPHQTPNFVRDISEYFPELDEAARIIRDEDGHRQLLVNAHSTGGLITPLWAHRVRDAGIVDGMFLNSPFFEINVSPLLRRTAGPAYAALARMRPYAKVRSSVSLAYGHSIHSTHHGEWAYDLTWKPLESFPVRAAWLTAIRTAQAELQAGLSIPAPILVACSTKTYRGKSWAEAAMHADAVLDVEHIAQYASRLGRHVTIVRVDGGLHDLTLSAPTVRGRVFDELDRWVSAYLPA
ncbi:alpha/beta hydrolase [Rugosimonospora africana]|uniref:alpha/beta hydrolase n=1 Tax=Rugosimonospora africana TaxID=556532 RepID=UPI0019423F73|nr:alpha/beta hydrolase [Rugosimonospora africana]